jgi:hypothetical protein
MLIRNCLLVGGALSCALPALRAQSQQTVIPAAYASTDAIGYLWLPGASRDVRQQTLVGSSHLTALVGRTLTAIELRRSAANETYAGGTAHMTVVLSTSPSRPLRSSRTWSVNVGPDATQVFAGAVTLPTSLPVTGPNVPWTPANVVRIQLQTPFVYHGGTLCIDVTGHPIAGQNANWWMADAMVEDLAGVAVKRGNGCGAFGGTTGQWGHAAARQLIPGGHASFFADGPPGSFGIAAIGSFNPMPIPLTALGLPSPGCSLHLASLDAMLVGIFEPFPHPALANRGSAEVRLWIPDTAAVFGVTFTTQWLEWTQLATSNAVEWTVAATIPTLDMAVIDGHPNEAFGEINVCMGHVLRLEHQ